MTISFGKYGSVVLGVVASAAVAGGLSIANLAPYGDDTGVLKTYSTEGAVTLSNPFFQQLGTNGRSCVTCHQPSDAWTVTRAHVQQRFASSDGLDPIFRTNDGADCPSADISTLAAREQAFGMLLGKGLIRFSMGMPSNANFSITADQQKSDLVAFLQSL